MIDEENERQVQIAQKDYLEFLDDEEGEGRYHGKVKDMIEERRIRLIVNLNDLRTSKPERAEKLLGCSLLEQIAFKNALKQYSNTLSPNQEFEELHVGFEGSFGHRHVSPRTLSSRFLNNMVCLEGIITQTSLPKIKLVRSVHYCPATHKMHERQYSDLTALSYAVTSTTYPNKDPDGNVLETEFGLSRYKDHQTIVMQEMPERAPAGQLPRSVDIICDDDLCDKVKPGDRVQIIGLYRCLPAKKGSFTNGVFRTVLIANNIKHLSKEFTKVFHRMDVRNCRKMSQKSNIFDLLANSLAPSIQGHEIVKKAILCMLLGGVEKVLPSGTRLRGDINILLMGDPSVAKSQLLRFVLCTAPRAIATTGRGSSGVGLTAAVTHDKETGERKLEAGAMVLADRGIVCIDEFDKMTDMDRTAIHEVMEQGRVTIAKAGIHARLNARCSVLAAANPVWGRYNRFKPPMENINLQASLLSRFDLLFVLLDEVDNERDTLISDHVVRMHRFRNPGEPDGAVLPMSLGVEFLTTGIVDDTSSSDAPVPVYEKYDPLLHGNLRKQSDRVFSQKFMRVYIELAKSSIKPVLTDEAIEAITEEYTRLRSHDPGEDGFAQTQPITVRTLETLIRLATAHAKARLSCEINLEDARTAIELVQYALFKKVIEKRRKRRHSSDDDSGGDDDDNDEATQQQRRRRLDPFEFGSQETGPEDLPSAPPPPPPQEESLLQSEETVDINAINQQRFETFKTLAAKVFQDTNKTVLSSKEFVSKIQEAVKDETFSKPEIQAAVTRMTEDNQIMVADDKVFLI